MSKYDHTSTAVADRYTKTLAELSEEAASSDAIVDDFQEFVSFMADDAAFGDFMLNPAVDAEVRGDVLEKHFRGRMQDLLLNTLQVVNRKGRGEIIPLIFERYRLELKRIRNEVDVEVVSAVALSDQLRDRIAETVGRVSGKKARLSETVDPSIIGGLVVHIGDQKLDASVSRQLESMREALMDRASAEIHSDKEYFTAGG